MVLQLRGGNARKAAGFMNPRVTPDVKTCHSDRIIESDCADERKRFPISHLKKFSTTIRSDPVRAKHFCGFSSVRKSKVQKLGQRRMVNARRLIARLSTFKIVFTLSSSGYCAIHWLVSHNFSTYVFSSALVFGAMAAMAIAWLANFALGGQARRGS